MADPIAEGRGTGVGGSNEPVDEQFCLRQGREYQEDRSCRVKASDLKKYGYQSINGTPDAQPKGFACGRNFAEATPAQAPDRPFCQRRMRRGRSPSVLRSGLGLGLLPTTPGKSESESEFGHCIGCMHVMGLGEDESDSVEHGAVLQCIARGAALVPRWLRFDSVRFAALAYMYEFPCFGLLLESNPVGTSRVDKLGIVSGMVSSLSYLSSIHLPPHRIRIRRHIPSMCVWELILIHPPSINDNTTPHHTSPDFSS